MSKLIVSIDGPSGSGKERIAKYIAKKYNFFHLDSGILYRRITAIIIKKKVKIYSKKNLLNFLKTIKYISPKKHKSLRKENISNQTSLIATIPLIREFINEHQKRIVKEKLKYYLGCVIDGRDIGSKVFKNAKIKLFIHAKPKIRAERRHKQLIEQGEKSIYSRILKDINLRDKTDKNRRESPLVVPKNAFIINNTKSFQSTISQINKILAKVIR